MKEPVFEQLHAQAVLQAGQDASRSTERPRSARSSAELVDPAAIALIPAPNPGDVFFDFEGDPLHQEPGWTDLGIEYLFGTIVHGPDGEPAYGAIWAHDRREERVALETVHRLADRPPRPARVRGPARLPLRALRGHRPQEAGAALRDPLRRARRAAEARACSSTCTGWCGERSRCRSARTASRSSSPSTWGSSTATSEGVTGGAESIVCVRRVPGAARRATRMRPPQLRPSWRTCGSTTSTTASPRCACATGC